MIQFDEDFWNGLNRNHQLVISICLGFWCAKTYPKPEAHWDMVLRGLVASPPECAAEVEVPSIQEVEGSAT